MKSRRMETSTNTLGGDGHAQGHARAGSVVGSKAVTTSNLAKTTPERLQAAGLLVKRMREQATEDHSTSDFVSFDA